MSLWTILIGFGIWILIGFIVAFVVGPILSNEDNDNLEE